jgi:hypothetical protein
LARPFEQNSSRESVVLDVVSSCSHKFAIALLNKETSICALYILSSIRHRPLCTGSTVLLSSSGCSCCRVAISLRLMSRRVIRSWRSTDPSSTEIATNRESGSWRRTYERPTRKPCERTNDFGPSCLKPRSQCKLGVFNFKVGIRRWLGRRKESWNDIWHVEKLVREQKAQGIFTRSLNTYIHL